MICSCNERYTAFCTHQVRRQCLDGVAQGANRRCCDHAELAPSGGLGLGAPVLPMECAAWTEERMHKRMELTGRACWPDHAATCPHCFFTACPGHCTPACLQGHLLAGASPGSPGFFVWDVATGTATPISVRAAAAGCSLPAWRQGGLLAIVHEPRSRACMRPCIGAHPQQSLPAALFSPSCSRLSPYLVHPPSQAGPEPACLLRWSPCGSYLLAAQPGGGFRIWETQVGGAGQGFSGMVGQVQRDSMEAAELLGAPQHIACLPCSWPC